MDKWFRGLKDRDAKQKILARLVHVENSHFGDYKQIYPKLYELRFFFSTGVRIYYIFRDAQIDLLLLGGNKSSQKRILTERNVY